MICDNCEQPIEGEVYWQLVEIDGKPAIKVYCETCKTEGMYKRSINIES